MEVNVDRFEKREEAVGHGNNKMVKGFGHHGRVAAIGRIEDSKLLPSLQI